MWNWVRRWWASKPEKKPAEQPLLPAPIDLRNDVARIFGTAAVPGSADTRLATSPIAKGPSTSTPTECTASNLLADSSAPEWGVSIDEGEARTAEVEGSRVTLGIDLGTTAAVVAVMMGNHVTVFANEEGELTTPNVVGLHAEGRLVGRAALRRAVTHPRQTLCGLKRYLTGISHSLAPGDALPAVEIAGQQYSPIEVLAWLLSRLKADAERHLGHRVHRAVVAVPACLDSAGRRVLFAAAQRAGFHLWWDMEDATTQQRQRTAMRLIHECEAAALAFCLRSPRTQWLGVFHWGAGGFEFAVIDAGQGVLRVCGCGGEPDAGGEAFDRLLAADLRERFEQRCQVSLGDDPVALERLRQAAEIAKRDLSAGERTQVILPYLHMREQGPCDLTEEIERGQWAQRMRPLLERCRTRLLHVLRAARCEAKQIDTVLLVGGMTRCPAVQALVKEVFGKPGVHLAEPDRDIAVGAAIYAAELLRASQSRVLLIRAAAQSLGIQVAGGEPMWIIHKGTAIPRSESLHCQPRTTGCQEASIEIVEATHDGPCRSLALLRFPLSVGAKPQIHLTFDLSADGLLKVTVTQDGGNRRSVWVNATLPTTTAENHWSELDAEYASQEEQQRQAIEDARREARTLLAEMERQLQDDGKAINRAALRQAMERLQRAVAGKSLTALLWEIANVRQVSPSPGYYTTSTTPQRPLNLSLD